MDKLHLDRQTTDGTQFTIAQLAELCPSAITEVTDPNTGKVSRKVNFTILRQMLGDLAVENPHEVYDFTWVGKTAAAREAAQPITKTLRPYPDESEDWENTQNVYIEGDNLQVLKLLQESYDRSVKMIYIDPPYNTGKDFVYHDDFHQTQEEYDEAAGAKDELGNRFRQNTNSNGRFHSDWCSMMYARLLVCRNMLADDGVIFISIDDNEVENLRKICDEVFGEDNFINNFMWLHGKGKKDTWSRTLQQYILAYAKNKKNLPEWNEREFTNYEFSNPDNDPKGKWFSGSLSFSEGRSNPLHPNYYTIKSPTGVVWKRQWQISEKEMNELINAGDVSWGDPIKQDGVPRQKIRPGIIDIIPNNIFENCGTTKGASNDLAILMGKECFSYPKPVELMKKLIDITTISDGIIIDFFSGSSTLAHAIMKKNQEDGSKIKFIMVQLPESLDENLKIADTFNKPIIT